MATRRPPTELELAAITATFTAYMAHNAAGGPLHWEVSPGHSVPPTAMGYLAEAGRSAWRELGLPETLWTYMVASGEGAEYIYRLHRDGGL